MSFLPEEPIEKPLVKGEVVCLVPSGAGRTGAQLAWGRVEICFPEFCSILIEAGQRGPSWLRAFLDEKSGNLPARMGLLRDHALVDDLYALGMLWLAALLRDPGDLEGAERLRDHLAEAIREGELAPGQTATMKKLVHASAQDRPMRLPPLELVDSRLPEEILGAVLHLGARLCGLFSPGYSGQSHEPVSRDQRTSVYASMLDDAAALVERLRDDLLGIPGGTGDLLRALEVFASSRGETYGGGDG